MARHKGTSAPRFEIEPEDLARLAEAHTALVDVLRTLKPAWIDRYTALLAVVVMIRECGRAWGAAVETWPVDLPPPTANLDRRGAITTEDLAELRKVDHVLIDLMRRYDINAHGLYIPLFASRLLLVRCAEEWSGRPGIWTVAPSTSGRPPATGI